MDTKTNMIALAGAYGLKLKFERPEERKVRFQGESTFVDVWFGKRGITIGIYDPRQSVLRYQHHINLLKFEDVLIDIQKRYG